MGERSTGDERVGRVDVADGVDESRGQFRFVKQFRRVASDNV